MVPRGKPAEGKWLKEMGMQMVAMWEVFCAGSEGLVCSE